MLESIELVAKVFEDGGGDSMDGLALTSTLTLAVTYVSSTYRNVRPLVTLTNNRDPLIERKES